MYSVTLHYLGYTIIVDNHLYSLELNPFRKFLSMDEVKKEVERMVEYFGEAPTEQRIEEIKSKIKQLADGKTI